MAYKRKKIGTNTYLTTDTKGHTRYTKTNKVGKNLTITTSWSSKKPGMRTTETTNFAGWITRKTRSSNATSRKNTTQRRKRSKQKEMPLSWQMFLFLFFILIILIFGK